MSIQQPMSVRTARQAGGAALLVAGATILMGIITAEALRPPGYSTARNDISDLGVAVQPSAIVFDVVMVVSSLLILVGAYGVYRAYQRRAVSISLALLGVGVLGVALFPGYPGNIVHPLVALLAFIAGGVASILAYRVTAGPFRVISMVLGTMALLSLVLTEAGVLTTVLGRGGAERWVAFPTVLWLVGFGGYVMAHHEEQSLASPLIPAGQRTTHTADGTVERQRPAGDRRESRMTSDAPQRVREMPTRPRTVTRTCATWQTERRTGIARN